MDYSKFYTPPEVADLLVQQLKINPPEAVVDICCGSCNLLHAANKRWSKTRLIGVDIIQHFSENIHCVQEDGRKYAINHYYQYPLVLANPPFDFVKEKEEFPSIYEDLPSKYSTSRLEIEMLLANLRLLCLDGTLAIIMPSTFVEAASNINIRKYIANKYYVQKIIHLPEETFGAAKINSYALIIKNNNECRRLAKKCFVEFKDGRYNILKTITITQKLIRDGNWSSSISSNSAHVKMQSRRGNISSQYFSSFGIPILHTAKVQNQWRPSIRHISKVIEAPVYAGNGDIIVSRVGKSAGQWYKYLGEEILISDCLYCIKDPKGEIAKKLQGNIYSLSLKGVATRYITMADFSTWYSSLD